MHDTRDVEQPQNPTQESDLLISNANKGENEGEKSASDTLVEDDSEWSNTRMRKHTKKRTLNRIVSDSDDEDRSQNKARKIGKSSWTSHEIKSLEK